ncbi:fumarylacetoacetate hydrolase family protein [Effusibacillus consociatus]|uniref:Fumarylacetoacetate hydrolase family protein n=1 Tax=Effusibacillus consociatus TaxID=1117041 RepID=A0ABV9PZV9_9BACL
MKLVTYENPVTSKPRLGWLINERIYDVEAAAAAFDHQLPSSMLEFLEMEEDGRKAAKEVYYRVCEQTPSSFLSFDENAVKLLAPIPHPRSFRDFYAFEQHVKTARSKRGLDMIPEWYEIPVFYFSNHQAICGPDSVIFKPTKTERLDFELEVACVIGRKGTHIAVDQAESYIAGFTILNDWSARDLQQQEMKVGLGPAKGKDFATSVGPWLVTPDELADKKAGNGYDLTMVARINGQEVSRGNLKDLYWSFSQMIARASEDVTLYPGDLIGSGTVGTGCILELGSENVPWLQPGDIVELEVERLGVLRNIIQ